MRPIPLACRRPGGPTHEALDPTQPIPPVGEEGVITDETLVFNGPMLFKTLPTTQLLVLTELAHGRGIAATARLNGINRATIHRWMQHDARFIAAWNQTQKFVQQDASARMTGLADKSMDNLAEQVRHGDKTTSMFVIRQLSKLRPGPISPRKVAKRIRRRDQRLEEYLNSPEDKSLPSPAVAPATPVITSIINEPAAPAALPPVSDDRDAQEKGGTPRAPEAPETRENEV